MIKYKLMLSFVLLVISMINLASCNYCKIFTFKSYKYTGDIELGKYEALKGKKIFLDPGHGGKGDSDQCRVGLDGITEEEVNLRVALILGDMLEKAGATVLLSRKKDVDMPLRDRVDLANKMEPDLLVSLHHNGSPRSMDGVNYPAVLIWGNKKVRPLSYSFAGLLMEEFQRIMDEKGAVVSDFSVYTETGTMILRETRYTCPGVIGEPGFFSDEKHAKRLKDIQYNQEEAEAYFYAMARFFERGIPGAEVLISVPFDNKTCYVNLIKNNKPIIAIKAESGLDRAGVIRESMEVALDGIPVRCKAVAEDLFFVDYGPRLYPGGHSIRFSFKNERNQSSMIYRAGFTVEIQKGDYSRLAKEGERLLKINTKRKEGLKMLLSALSMGLTDPDSGRLIWNIARGFELTGDRENSDYYYAKLYNFYPQSKYSKNPGRGFNWYRFPVNYNGKWINIKYEPLLKDESNKLLK